ncbi:MAG: carbonic anhydrase family protein, partial [Chloroflexota bacterium]
MTDRMLDGVTPSGLTRRRFARRAATWVVASGAMAALAACGSKTPAKSAAKKTTKPHGATEAAHGADAGAHGAPHWDYEGVGGPDRWAELAPENAVCSAGSTQSPIDIAGTQPGLLGRTSIKWQAAPLSVVNNGHTIQADVANGGAIEVDGVPYTLVQFHFHAPSEHTVNGKRFAMETHFVH